MSKTIIPCTLAAMTLAVAGFAFAQGNDSSPSPRPADARVKPEVEKMTLGQRGNSPQDQRRQMDHGAASAAGAGRGAGPQRDLYKGSKLPSALHNKPEYVVDDWRAHHLSAPPPGHHWVQAGDDFVLVAVTTGVIARTMIPKRP